MLVAAQPRVARVRRINLISNWKPTLEGRLIETALEPQTASLQVELLLITSPRRQYIDRRANALHAIRV